MKIAPVADVKAHLSGYLEACRKAPVVVTKNGRPAAVLVAVPEDDEDLERLLLAHTPRFRRLLDDAMRRIAESGGVDHDAFWDAVERMPRSRQGQRKPLAGKGKPARH